MVLLAHGPQGSAMAAALTWLRGECMPQNWMDFYTVRLAHESHGALPLRFAVEKVAI